MALRYGRQYIGIEPSDKYIEISLRRLTPVLSQEVFDFTPAPEPEQLALPGERSER